MMKSIEIKKKQFENRGKFLAGNIVPYSIDKIRDFRPG